MSGKRKTIYSLEYWLEKGLTEEESLEKIKTVKKENSCWCKEYWMKKGFNEEESIKKVKEKQQSNSKKRTKDSYKKMKNPYQIEYWLEKGFTKEESLNKIKKHKDKTNPYNVLSEDNIKNMIDNRKKTYYNKSDFERAKINKSRGRTKEQYILEHSEEEYYDKLKKQTEHFSKDCYIEKFGEDKYKEWRNNQKESLKKRNFIKFSKISFDLFNEIGLDAFYGKNEKCLTLYKDENKYIIYPDFLYENKIIEFYGDYFHGNPDFYDKDDIIGTRYKNYKVGDKWEYDKNRQNILKDNGYDVLIIWENDYKKHKKEIIEKCKKWIKNL